MMVGHFMEITLSLHTNDGDDAVIHLSSNQKAKWGYGFEPGT